MFKPDKILRSRRKTIQLTINENGELIVKAPFSVSNKKILEFVSKHTDWIIDTREKVQRSISKFRNKKFVDGETYFILGEIYKLKLVDPDRLSEPIKLNHIHKKILLNSNYRSSAKTILINFYKDLAYEIIEKRVERCLLLYKAIFNEDLTYTRIKISNARRRLGSCSPKGVLSFSWRIIQAPMEVVDHVVAHEIVHLKIKNHQKDFWLEMIKLRRNYESEIKWIKENWFELREFLNDKS